MYNRNLGHGTTTAIKVQGRVRVQTSYPSSGVEMVEDWFIGRDEVDKFLWHVTNCPWEGGNYEVVYEGGKEEFVLRTKNRKYYKRWRVPALVRMGMGGDGLKIGVKWRGDGENLLVIEVEKTEESVGADRITHSEESEGYEIRLYEEGSGSRERGGKVRRIDRVLKYLKLRKASTSSSASSECLNLLPSNDLSLRQCSKTRTWRDEFGHLYQGDECIREEGGEEGCKRFSFIPYTPTKGGRNNAGGGGGIVEELEEEQRLLRTPLQQPHQNNLDTSTRLKPLAQSILLTANPTSHMSLSSQSPPSPTIHPPHQPLHTSASSPNDLHIPALELPSNPYILTPSQSSYVDPSTGLTYPTRFDVGPPGLFQTLVGVGIYTRTYFKIKVYGLSFHVDADEARSDPSMRAYAGYGKEELAGDEGFYECMMNMGCKGKGGRGLPSEGFGRTITLKLNMQLDAETMRNSLEADWELLTDQQKSLLTSSSFKPRPASASSISNLRSGSTTCTCGQAAPLSFPLANPLCCARGTSLAFTWTKGGALEVRLDGSLMDRFEDPSMGKAIFYEYFRGDDPISEDFRARAVEGFPSVLAPVLQLKDVHLGGGGREGRKQRRTRGGTRRWAERRGGGGPASRTWRRTFTYYYC
ncbi:hypothetical protein TrRE_jg4500 [Triparma retinervis]|uniref:Uncharacterized protein n=1 Tax=Triparma retinervis TaxID=2557542 RepID=A0A9W7FBC3_9STRA|nr:hypothetical protein TrRE_jg4500 [Triparma retinervis]